MRSLIFGFGRWDFSFAWGYGGYANVAKKPHGIRFCLKKNSHNQWISIRIFKLFVMVVRGN